MKILGIIISILIILFGIFLIIKTLTFPILNIATLLLGIVDIYCGSIQLAISLKNKK